MEYLLVHDDESHIGHRTTEGPMYLQTAYELLISRYWLRMHGTVMICEAHTRNVLYHKRMGSGWIIGVCAVDDRLCQIVMLALPGRDNTLALIDNDKAFFPHEFPDGKKIDFCSLLSHDEEIRRSTLWRTDLDDRTNALNISACGKALVKAYRTAILVANMCKKYKPIEDFKHVEGA